MSGLRVSNLRGVAGSAPTFPDGVVVTGVSTATTFDGNLTGNVTGNIVGSVTGDVTGNVNVTGDATFTGDVSIGGTLTYQDVTNVDSIGVVTARGGIKVGVGQSISAVSGIITYYGDGSQLTGVESGVSNFVASGNIGNGDTVVVKTDGTVGVVTSTTTGGTFGSEGTFETGTATGMKSIAFDEVDNKVVIAYYDGSNGKAVVGTVSGSNITFGTPVQFDSGECEDIAVAAGKGKICIVYKKQSNSRPRIIGGDVSGTSITFGNYNEFQTSQGNAFAITYDPIDANNSRFLFAYRDYGNSYAGTARFVEISATGTPGTVNLTSAVVYDSTQATTNALVYDSNAGKSVIFWSDAGSSGQGKARVVSGNAGSAPSYGTEATFESGKAYQFTTAAFDSENNKVVLAYMDGNTFKGKCVVGTINGTDISFGTAVQFNGTDNVETVSTGYDPIAKKIIVTYRDSGDSNKGKLIEGTVSGTSITFGSEKVFNDADSYIPVSTFDSSNNKVVIAFKDIGDSAKGKAVVYESVASSTNLTTENYIGIAAEAISNGATGKVTIFGGTNSGQTGLTTAQTYYVQTDGSLSTTAGTPSVVAGTSISSTKIIVKG